MRGDDPSPATPPVAAPDAAVDGTPPSTQDGAAAPDSSTGTDAGLDADAATFDPRSLSNLRLWLESSRGVTTGPGGVVSWADGSGRWDGGGAGAPDGGQHQALHLGAKTAPTLQNNGIAGRPSLSFQGSTGNGDPLEIAMHPDFAIDTGDFLAAFALKLGTGDGLIFSHASMSIPRFGLMISNADFCWSLFARGGDRCTTPKFALSTEPHVLVVLRKGKDMVFRVDGTTRSSANVLLDDPDLTPSTPTLSLGAGPPSLVSEVVLLVGPTPDADRLALEAYMKSKYGIP